MRYVGFRSSMRRDTVQNDTADELGELVGCRFRRDSQENVMCKGNQADQLLSSTG